MSKYSGRNKINPIEPPCKKTVYQSLEEANEMINHIESTRVTRQIRPYKCSICGLWHLTSKSGK